MQQIAQNQIREQEQYEEGFQNFDQSRGSNKQVSNSRLHGPPKLLKSTQQEGGMLGQLCLLITSCVFCMILVGFTIYSFTQVKTTITASIPKTINAVFIQTKGSIETSLESFKEFNDYPLHSIMAIVKKMPKKQFTKQFSKVKWVVCACDQPKQLYSKLDDIVNAPSYDYLFYFDDSWKFKRQGFINESIRLLQKFPRVQQILLQNQLTNFNVSSPAATKNVGMMGFSFAAGLHRRQDLVELPGGFTRFYFESERENIPIEKKISDYFLLKYMYALCGNTQFANSI